MKISINRASATEVPAWVAVEGSPQTVSDLLSRGVEVGPVLALLGNKLQFQSADWIFVELACPNHLIEGMLDHPFTQQHAGVVWLGDKPGGETACLIGFPLSATLTDRGRYRLLPSGLATVYGAIRPGKDHSGWRVAAGGSAVALTGQLDEKAVERLAVLGQENNSHRADKLSYVRSAVRLDRNASVACANGSEAVLTALAEGTRIFCPVHVDTLGVASVIGTGNIKAAQCPCCLRNYWNTPVKRGSDFGHFRRVFDTLHEQEEAEGVQPNARQFTLLREQYLPALKLRYGFTLVRSPKGRGKTEALVKLVEECCKRNLSVLLVGHRRALLRSLSQRLNLDLYFESMDGADGSTEFRAVKATDRYAICLDSVPGRLKPDVHRFDVVLVDESEQVIRHLAGATLKRARKQAFLKFQHYLATARFVYMLDADLGMLSLSMALGSAHSDAMVRIVVNEPEVEPQDYDLVTTREGLMAKLQSALDANKKCYVATNSKAAAERIGLWIAERWKDKRIETVHRDNAQTTRVQDLLSNLVEEFQTGLGGMPPLDVLVGSPSIGTGIDITFPDGAKVVDHVFGLFECGINTHHDIDQQLARVRHPGHMTVWVNRNVMHYETDPAALRNELRNTVLRTDLLVGFTREGKPIYSEADKPLLNLWAEIISYERASKNELFNHWTALREENGWTANLDITSEEDKARGKNAMLDGKALRDAARVARIIDAREIDDEEAEGLADLDSFGGSMTDDERASLEKYRMEKFYAAEVDADLVAFDDDGKTQRQVKWLEIMVGDRNYNRGIDEIENNRKEDAHVIIFDRQFRCAKAEILGQLMVAAGLLDAESGEFDVDALVSTETLGEFTSCFKANRKRIDSELGLDMRRDIDRKPVQQLGAVLSLIGVEVVLEETTKSKGVKQRSYRLNAEMLVELLEVVVRRQQQREEKSELKQKAAETEDGDNGHPDINNELENELSPEVERSDDQGRRKATVETSESPMAILIKSSKAKQKTAKADNSSQNKLDRDMDRLQSVFNV